MRYDVMVSIILWIIVIIALGKYKDR